jgi:hypothetical protein
MTTESVHAWIADADLFLPAEGLSLLGEYQGSGYAGRRFQVGRSNGQVIQLSLQLYLIMAAIAEGGVDGGWSADQVGAQVGAASGQGLTADNVRYLVAGTLAPLGLIAAGGADRPDGAPGTAQPPRVNLLPGLKIRDVLPHLRAGGGGPGPPGDRVVRPRLRLRLGCREWRWALAIGGTAVLVWAAAVAAIMAGTGNRETGGTPSASASTSTSAPAPAPALASAPAPALAAAASRSQAAAWVAQQVSPDVAVSCDPGMCRQLQLDGFPVARLKPLPRSARVPLGSGVVVATPAIRSQVGPRLAAVYAPQVIASFGSGAARVDVRTITPPGGAAFAAKLAAEQAVLASAGRQLLGNKNIQASPSARSALRAGQVDARLLAILSLLSAQSPVRLVGFTGAPGAGPGVPLRGAEIGVTSPTARAAVVALLDAQQSPYRPAVAAVADGSRSVVALWFDAPASLDLSQP